MNIATADPFTIYAGISACFSVFVAIRFWKRDRHKLPLAVAFLIFAVGAIGVRDRWPAPILVLCLIGWLGCIIAMSMLRKAL